MSRVASFNVASSLCQYSTADEVLFCVAEIMFSNGLVCWS